MSHHRLTPSVHEQQNQLAGALKALRTTLELPGPFPEVVLRDAAAAVAEHKLPDLDLTHVEFVTIDPASSTDLDQALFIERSDGGDISTPMSAKQFESREWSNGRDGR